MDARRLGGLGELTGPDLRQFRDLVDPRLHARALAFELGEARLFLRRDDLRTQALEAHALAPRRAIRRGRYRAPLLPIGGD